MARNGRFIGKLLARKHRHTPARNRDNRPQWEREADNLRHVVTGIVAVIAAFTVAGANLYVDAQIQQAAQQQTQQEQQAIADAQAEARAQQEAEAEAQQARASKTVNATETATAEGARPTSGNIVVTGCPNFGSTAEFAQLTQAIGTFEDQGYSISVTLVDISTGRSLRYRADAYYYSASSIKAPVTVAGYEREVDAGTVGSGSAGARPLDAATLASIDSLAEATLVKSDNDAYLQLRDIFGSSNFNAWLVDAGVESGAYPTVSQLADTHYPHISTNQMATMWRHIYDYLQSGTASAQKIVSYMRKREVSPIKDALGASNETWSKAGWIDVFGEGGAEPATWDAGVVFAPSGTYIVAIASSAPSELSTLSQVVPALDAAHTAVVAAQ